MKTQHIKSLLLVLPLVICTNSWAGTMKFYAVHTDQLGTPQVITDENKNVVWEADRDPFGKVTNTITNNFAMNVALPGQYTDAETNYNQNWNRDYDPNTGRYLQSDPIGQRGGVNTYIYANANPVNWSDPMGLMGLNDFWIPNGWCMVEDKNGRHYSAPPCNPEPPKGPDQCPNNDSADWGNQGAAAPSVVNQAAQPSTTLSPTGDEGTTEHEKVFGENSDCGLAFVRDFIFGKTGTKIAEHLIERDLMPIEVLLIGNDTIDWGACAYRRDHYL